MVTPEFNRLLLEALTPITLISSVGLLMLCMTARYNHTTNSLRYSSASSPSGASSSASCPI